MSIQVDSQFDQGLNGVNWMEHPELMQKVVSAFMIEMSDTLNQLRAVLALAEAMIAVQQLQCGFAAANSMETSGLIQAGIGAAQVAGGGYQIKAAFNTATEMKALRAGFEEKLSNLDSRLNSANTSVEPVPVMSEIEEDGIVIQARQVDNTPEDPVSQERVDEDTLHAQKKTLRNEYEDNLEKIRGEHQKHYGIGQVISGSGGMLHIVDGGTLAKKAINEAANGSFEHNYQTQEATRNSVNQTVDKLLSIDMYAVNVASSRA